MCAASCQSLVKLRSCRAVLERYLKPETHRWEKKLVALTPQDVQQWLNQLAQQAHTRISFSARRTRRTGPSRSSQFKPAASPGRTPVWISTTKSAYSDARR